MFSKKLFTLVLLSFVLSFFTTSCEKQGSSTNENLDKSKPSAPAVSYSATSTNGTTTVAVNITSKVADGSTIHYTTDGTEPTPSSPVYTGPVTITGNTDPVKIAAIVVKDGKPNSEVATVVYGKSGETNTGAVTNENSDIKTRYQTIDGVVYKISYRSSVKGDSNPSSAPEPQTESCTSRCSNSAGGCQSHGCEVDEYAYGCTEFSCLGPDCNGNCSYGRVSTGSEQL